MNRRDFIIRSVLALLGISLPLKKNIIARALAADNVAPDIIVSRGQAPPVVTEAAIRALGGMKRFVSRGDRVIIKPNIGWDRTPEMAATTNPDVVATLTRLCRDAGAKEVLVFDRTINDARRCYRQSGIEEAVTAAGGVMHFVDDRKFRDVTINGLALTKWPLYTEIFEADAFINVPIAKIHSLADLTLGMKNLMGVMGGWRGRIHQRLDESIVDLAATVPVTLVVLDAIRILIRNGPQGGRLEDVRRLDTVIAGTDQVAVDAYGTTLFGMRGADIGAVRLGAENGIGTADLSALTVRKIES